MLPELVNIRVGRVVQRTLAAQVRIHAEAELNPVFLTLANDLLVGLLLRFRQVFPPAVDLGIPPRVVLDIAHAAVAVHQEVHLVLRKHRDLRQVLLGLPHPSLDTANRESGLPTRRQRLRELAERARQRDPEVLGDVTHYHEGLTRYYASRDLEPRRPADPALRLPIGDRQSVHAFL